MADSLGPVQPGASNLSPSCIERCGVGARALVDDRVPDSERMLGESGQHVTHDAVGTSCGDTRTPGTHPLGQDTPGPGSAFGAAWRSSYTGNRPLLPCTAGI